MNFINSYVKKIVKKTIFLSTALVFLMAVSLVVISAVNGLKIPHAKKEDILLSLIFIFSMPAIISGVAIGLPLLKTYYQINKYFGESSKEEQEELHGLLKRECSEKEARWHFQARYSEQFMVFLPDVVIKKDELSSCKRLGTKRYWKGGTYYQVKVIFKSGKKKVIDYSTLSSVDTTIRWWKQK